MGPPNWLEVIIHIDPSEFYLQQKFEIFTPSLLKLWRAKPTKKAPFSVFWITYKNGKIPYFRTKILSQLGFTDLCRHTNFGADSESYYWSMTSFGLPWWTRQSLESFGEIAIENERLSILFQKFSQKSLEVLPLEHIKKWAWSDDLDSAIPPWFGCGLRGLALMRINSPNNPCFWPKTNPETHIFQRTLLTW